MMTTDSRLQPTVPSETEQRFAREIQRDQRLRRMFGIGATTIAVTTLVTLYILMIPLGRSSPWLVMLTLYSVGTRLSTLVSWSALLYPRFLLRLDDTNPAVSAAAAAVLERHRVAVVRPILKHLWRDFDEAAIAAVDPAELASLAREYDVERHRRFGRRWFAGWCLVSLVIWGTVIATGGGPAE